MSNTKIPSVLWSADQTGVLSSDDIARAKANIGLATAVVLKGSATVAQLNSMTQDGEHVLEAGLATGWQFTMSDSGTLRAGLLVVSSGDKVVWNGSSWEMAGGAGGGTYVLNAAYNVDTNTWTTLPTQSDFDNMDASGTVILKVARSYTSGDSTGWYAMTSKRDNAIIGMTEYTFTGSSTMEILSNTTIPKVQQIMISVPMPSMSGTSISCTVSDKTDVFKLSARYVVSTDTWTWPEGSELEKASNYNVVVLDLYRDNGGTIIDYTKYILYRRTFSSGNTTLDFMSCDNAVHPSRLRISVNSRGQISGQAFTSLGKTYIINAEYNMYTSVYTWPNADILNELIDNLRYSNAQPMTIDSIILEMKTQTSGPITYRYYPLTYMAYGGAASGGVVFGFTGYDFDHNLLYYQLKMAAPGASTVTATVEALPSVHDFEAKSGNNSWPDGSTVVNSKGLVQIRNGGSYGSETVFYYNSYDNSYGSGTSSYRTMPRITDSGIWNDPTIQYTSGQGWSYEVSSDKFVDYRHQLLAYNGSEPLWTATHLIYGSASYNASCINLASCVSGKMYYVHHCYRNSSAFLLKNNTSKNFTVYDCSSATYTLSQGYNITLFSAGNSKSVIASFMMLNNSLYITYGY